MHKQDTIIALATPSGAGAIGVLRISGSLAISITESLFKSIHNKNLTTQPTHSIHLGHIFDGDSLLDEVLVSLFKNPKSYTGTLSKYSNLFCAWRPNGTNEFRQTHSRI